MPMRVLVVSHTFPYPPVGGSRVRLWNVVSRLVETCHVHVLTTEPPQGEWHLAFSVEVIPARPSRSLQRRISKLMWTARKRFPVWVFHYRAPSFVQRLRHLVAQGTYDLVYALGNPTSWVPVELAGQIPVVLEKHSVAARDARERHNNPWRSLWEVSLTKHLERLSLRTATETLCLTPEDLADLRQLYGDFAGRVVPVGVDMDRFSYREDPGTNVVGFLGDFSWGANVDAAQWLLTSIWPRVLEAVPQARLKIVGRNARKLAERFTDATRLQVDFLSDVDDVASAFQDVAVAVAPLRQGTGIRFKVLEYCAMGIPTVTTSLGARGLEAWARTLLRIADSEEAFAREVASLLAATERRRALGADVYKIAQAYSWESAMQALLDVFKSVVAAPL